MVNIPENIEKHCDAYYKCGIPKGEFVMGRRRGIMSDRLKEELAKELGFYDVVQNEGWGGIKARDAGNMVKRAIELAEQQLANSARE
jgi:small acid-soluble spore protein F (minor alpha/beta-type SASP)